MAKIQRKLILPLFLAAAVLAGGFSAGALEYEDGVRGEKTVAVLSEKERSFRLDYRVWSEDWVSRSVTPCDVLLLLDVSCGMEEKVSSGKGESPRLECMQKGVKAFLEELAEVSPETRAGLVLFGENVSSSGPEKLDGPGLAGLLSALSGAKAETGGEPDLTGALERAAALAEKLEGDRPLYLITAASGLWAGETEKVLPALQALRGDGAKCYTALLREDPEEEIEAFWQAVSSAPLTSCHCLCGGEVENCLRQIRRAIASALSVEVTERLDPRFTLSESEQERLREEGAHLNLGEDGAWTVSWEADLPRRKDSPWSASLAVQAKEDFPGGNDVPTDGEGTGIYRYGKEIVPLGETTVNVPLSLSLKDLEAGLFLGERVRTTVNGTNVEDAMAAASTQSWFGRGQTGSFSYLWETESGDPVGSLKQLEAQRPEKDISYRLRVTFRPASQGLDSAGTPVEDTEETALYKIRVTKGSLRIKVADGSGRLSPNAGLLFRVEMERGGVLLCAARPEADPQSGRMFLQGELTGLPYGTYRVVPVSGNGAVAGEAQVCKLGVWEKDDTVSTARNTAQARFTLIAEPPETLF